MVHSEDTINAVRKLRRKGLSFSEIGRSVNLTKGQVLGLVYRHVLYINRHKYYEKRKKVPAYNQEDKRPTVSYVPGLKNTIFYKMKER